MRGNERVPERPTLNDWFALMSVRTGLNHDGSIFPPLSTTSGTPLGLSISWMILISDPSGNHLITSPIVLPSVPSETYVLSSYHSSHG